MYGTLSVGMTKRQVDAQFQAYILAIMKGEDPMLTMSLDTTDGTPIQATDNENVIATYRLESAE